MLNFISADALFPVGHFKIPHFWSVSRLCLTFALQKPRSLPSPYTKNGRKSFRMRGLPLTEFPEPVRLCIQPTSNFQ